MSRPCTAVTRAGDRCKNAPLAGRDVCRVHSGQANAGQRTKLTEELIHKISAAVRAGNFIEPACRFVGISTSTFYAWRERGEADIEAGITSPHADFYEATERAYAESELVAVAQLRSNVTGGDQRAIEYFLERRFPSRWGRRQTLEATVAHQGRPTRPPDVPADEERMRELARIAAEIGVLPDTSDASIAREGRQR